MAESFESVDEPPPRPGGFDGDGTRRGELGEEQLDSCGIVRQAMLGQLAVGGEDRERSTPAWTISLASCFRVLWRAL